MELLKLFNWKKAIPTWKKYVHNIFVIVLTQPTYRLHEPVYTLLICWFADRQVHKTVFLRSWLIHPLHSHTHAFHSRQPWPLHLQKKINFVCKLLKMRRQKIKTSWEADSSQALIFSSVASWNVDRKHFVFKIKENNASAQLIANNRSNNPQWRVKTHMTARYACDWRRYW